MTDFHLDSNDYSMTPIQLMKIRGATEQEIKQYKALSKKRKQKDWGCLVSVSPQKRSSSTKSKKSN
jgi:hypothetical protein